MYIVYIIEMYYFSLMRTSSEAINVFEVKVDVRKGALRFNETLIIGVLVSSNSHFHSLLSYGHSLQ